MGETTLIPNGITVNECYRMFIKQESKENRFIVKNHALTVLSLEDSISFLNKCITWLLNHC